MDKIEKSFGVFLCLAIVLLVMGICFADKFVPEKGMTQHDEIDMDKLLVELNSDLPKKVGTIGTQDSITYENNTLIYNHTVHGGDYIKRHLLEHYSGFKDLVKYSMVAMNGQKNNGKIFAHFLSMKGLSLCLRIYTGPGDPVSWTITGDELKEFTDSCKMNPTESMKTIVDMMILYANLLLPINKNEAPAVDNVLTNSMASNSDGCLLQIVERLGNTIVFIYNVDEEEYDLKAIRENAENEEKLEEMARLLSEDDDIRELWGMFALSHSDLAMKYVGRESKDSAVIKIPYQLLRKYGVVPENLLLEK